MCSLDINELTNMQQNLDKKNIIIVKFTADWCGPCKNIKQTCDNYIKNLPNSIKFFEIDIDESIELYVFLKSKKQVNGIPAILAYYTGEKDNYYLPDDSCIGGNIKNVSDFFERCLKYVK